MNISLPYRRLNKPKRVVGIDWAHPLTKDLVACLPLTEGAGRAVELVRKQVSDGNQIWTGNSPYGVAVPTAAATGGGGNFGDAPYNTAGNLTAACLLDVVSWTTATSGDFFYSKNSYQTRGWILLNDGTFADRVGIRTDGGGTSTYAYTTRAAVGTGLMLFVGRRTGTTIQFVTVKASGLTQHSSVSEAGGGMANPSGSNLSLSTQGANGNVKILSAWLWSSYLSDAQLRELFAEPYRMLQVDRGFTMAYAPTQQGGGGEQPPGSGDVGNGILTAAAGRYGQPGSNGGTGVLTAAAGPI